MTEQLYREGRKWARLTTGTNVLRATGQSAWLHSIVTGDPADSSITIYNNGSDSGEVVAIMDTTNTGGGRRTYPFNVRLDNGLTVKLLVDMDITVIYE